MRTGGTRSNGGSRKARGIGSRDTRGGGSRGREAPAWVARLGDATARGINAVGLERWARLASTAVVPLLIPDGRLGDYGPYLATLSAYVLLTALARRDRYLRAADLVVAAALLATSGEAVVAFIPFVLVTIAGPASRGGIRAGLAAGGTLSLVLFARLVITGDIGEFGGTNLLSVMLLLPLTGLTTAAATGVLEDDAVHERRVLQQANRLLSSLRDLAEEIPGGLDVSTVSAALAGELRALPGAEDSLVLVEDHEMLLPMGAHRSPGRAPVTALRVEDLRENMSDRRRLHPPDTLPAALATTCAGAAFWLVVPMGDPRAPSGALLAGFALREDARHARARVTALAADGSLAIENARLFDATRIRAADAARRGVAGDLHDGVAQSLAHLRMELELRARDPVDDPELARLARIAGSALGDLRNTIAGLRAPLDHDLGALLERHVDDLRSSGGPTLRFRQEGTNRLDPERAAHVLRVAQEALSNALRHADPATVEVALLQDATEVRLVVRDDGSGFSEPSPEVGGGVGLRSMQERADLLRGTLELESRPGGGTRVVLTVPTARPGPDPAREQRPLRRESDPTPLHLLEERP